MQNKNVFVERAKILGLLGAPIYVIVALLILMSKNSMLILVFFALTFYMSHRRFKKKYSD